MITVEFILLDVVDVVDITGVVVEGELVEVVVVMGSVISSSSSITSRYITIMILSRITAFWS